MSPEHDLDLDVDVVAPDARLDADGLERLPDAESIEKAAKADLLRRRRSVDGPLSRELVARGWRQGGPLDGLMWCATCGQPTVWKDPAGHARHHTCVDVY